MAKIKFKGLEAYERQLMKIQKASKDCIGKAIYEGAAVVADAVKESINALPIDDRIAKRGQILHGITPEQKDGLIDGFGISKMRDDSGYINVKIGFDGYNSMVTKKYPQGQPNSMIARSVNSGTSFRQRIPFVDNAVRSKKDAAEKKMADAFDEAIKGEL